MSRDWWGRFTSDSPVIHQTGSIPEVVGLAVSWWPIVLYVTLHIAAVSLVFYAIFKEFRRILAFVLVCALASALYAAVAHDGNVAVAATSGTFSATATGDLKIVCAFNNTNTTIPTLPGTYTSILTISGFSRATRCGCNDSSSSGDTGTGTWTNATKVAGISYSGTAVGNTANCNTTGVGASSNNSNSIGAGSTISYLAVTFTVTSGTSWGFAYCGQSLLTTCATAPALMTNQANQGTGPTIGVHDTGSGVTGWSTTAVSSSTTVYHDAVIEILAAAASTTRNMPGAVF